MLSVKNLVVNINSQRILNGINISIKPGEVVAVMGPNGSGKSTLAKAIMGDKRLEVFGDINFEGKDILDLSPDERSKKGIFLSFQSPPEIEGINSEYFLSTSIDTEWDAVVKLAKKLGIKSELFSKDLNVGFSGGERKKIEMLQAILKDPKLIVLDEIDSGLDIDSIKVVDEFMKDMKKRNKGLLIITHYTRIFTNIQPDKVYVLVDGKIAGEGGPEILSKLDKFGFKEWK
ncbi:MAG: Fe-S cluster assembly ATPase SufC [Candidatus Altiarchaeota archaeon]|nr:Fe-S cluster assembly ATPase SufC [Candidatus Altiarchaeota archaeon]